MSLFSKIGQWTDTHSYCTQTHTDTHTCGAYNPVLPWRLRFSQQVGQPLNLTSCLLCCLCIYFSPQLNSLNPKSLSHPSHPVLQHYSYPLPTKAGKYSMVSTRDKKRNRDRHRGERQGKVEKGAELFLSLFLFLLFFFDRSLQSLPAWLVKVSAAWQAGLFWQASNSWLCCPLTREREREKEGRTNIVTARLYCTEAMNAVRPFLSHTHTGEKFVTFPHLLHRATVKHFTVDVVSNTN